MTLSRNLMDISDLTKASNNQKGCPWRVWGRGGDHALRKRENKTTEVRSGLNNSKSHAHVQGSSTATWMALALTTYHNNPTDFIDPGYGPTMGVG
jgi:hypothetical protein